MAVKFFTDNFIPFQTTFSARIVAKFKRTKRDICMYITGM